MVKVVTDGVPATAMMSFKDRLSDQEILALVKYVRAFDKKLAGKPAPRPRPRQRPARTSHPPQGRTVCGPFRLSSLSHRRSQVPAYFGDESDRWHI